MKRIAIIAGELSGDLLAARLIHSLKQLQPDLEFEGIAGKEMQAAGCRSLFSMETLSVMGLTEVLSHLPKLLSIRRQLFQRWCDDPPDLFIGVDAPDFNLPLAKKLHKQGIPTVHYVSPSVWAWREKRVKKIQGNIDLMLVLFPFEADFYKRHHIPVRFVGHPLADEIDFNAPPVVARQALGLDAERRVLAVLPGSRKGEISRIAADFMQAAERLQKKYPDLQVVVPIADTCLLPLIKGIQLECSPEVKVIYLEGNSRLLMQAADYILLASGTAVLEGMLCGRLMVAAYRVSKITWWIIQIFGMLKVDYVTLPNNLLNEPLVPEVLQNELKPERLMNELERVMLLSGSEKSYVLGRFSNAYSELKRNSSASAAQAIVEHFST